MKYSIETCIAKVKVEKSFCTFSQSAYGTDFKRYQRDIDVFDDIIEVLEKQVAKKPIDNEDWEYGLCPNCRSHRVADYEYDRRFKHCSDCGQAIERGEYNEKQ